MFAVVSIVLGLAVFHLAASQDRFYLPAESPRQFPEADQFSQSRGSDGTFPGVPSGVAQVDVGQNTFPTFGGVSGQSGLGVFSVPSQQGPAFLGGQGGSFAGAPVFGQVGVPGFGVQQVGVPGFGVQQVGVPGFGAQQVGVPGFGVQVGGVQGAGTGFPSSIIQEEVTPTVTQTVTVDTFQTLTDLVLHSVAVTLTQFSLVTTTRVTQVVVPTPVNDALAVPTSVVVQPAYVTVTETKSDFRVVVKTSVSYATLTHTSYAITHVPFTLSTTETVTVTSPVVRTVISTHVEGVTNYRTITNTAYVHGGYH